MMHATWKRRAVRRAVRAHCQAVSLDAFRLVGDKILDLSTRGMLVACDEEVERGQALMVSFVLPKSGRWLDVEAEVARVIEGNRPFDPGYCAGLRFVEIDPDARGELLVSLAGVPPPVPQRPYFHLA